MGNFTPSLYRTPLFEVGIKHHREGSVWPAHYQIKATEYNCLIAGMMLVQHRKLLPNDLFTISPGEVVKPCFLTDCTVVVVKVPSLPHDKVIL